MLSGRALEEDICPRIDEEVGISRSCRLTSVSDASALIGYIAECSIRWKAVLQVAAYGARFDRQGNGLTDHFRRVTIAAFQIDRYRKIRRGDDPAQIVDRHGERDLLAIGEVVCIGNRPTAGCDRLGAARGDCFGTPGIPDVEQDERISWDMQRPELLALVLLIGHFLLLDRSVAMKSPDAITTLSAV